MGPILYSYTRVSEPVETLAHQYMILSVTNRFTKKLDHDFIFRKLTMFGYAKEWYYVETGKLVPYSKRVMQLYDAVIAKSALERKLKLNISHLRT